jgi:protein-disulfide isomerase/uncharacterized membrane protein
MKARIQLAMMGCLISVAIQLYLTLHYYQLKFGFAAATSVCNISTKFNCDAVAASNFSSLFGLPISIWGAALNIVMFVMILWSWLEWSATPERLKRWTLLLCGLSVTGSIVMGVIAVTAMDSYCLMCLSLYVLSVLIFWAFRGAVTGPFWSEMTGDLPHLLAENKGILVAFVAVPLLAFLMHRSFIANNGIQEMDSVVTSTLEEWQQSPQQNFVAKPSLILGAAADKAALTLVEFADFRCSHCKHASYTLDAFVRSHSNVRFEFYSFPLDGACNEKYEKMDGSTGISCRLAAAALCAEKENKGWDVHHRLYEIQDQVNALNTVTELDNLLAQNLQDLGLNREQLQSCLIDPSTQDSIRAQAKQGVLVNVQGTPTIFANGRLLNGAQLLPVLQGALSRAGESSSAH